MSNYGITYADAYFFAQVFIKVCQIFAKQEATDIPALIYAYMIRNRRADPTVNFDSKIRFGVEIS